MLVQVEKFKYTAIIHKYCGGDEDDDDNDDDDDAIETVLVVFTKPQSRMVGTAGRVNCSSYANV